MEWVESLVSKTKFWQVSDREWLSTALKQRYGKGPFVRFLSLFCVCLFLVIGCGKTTPPSPTPTTESQVQEQLIIGIKASRIRTLDPADAYEIVAGNLLYNLGDRLYTYEPETAKLTPQLATALPTVSEDGLLYTIPLRDNVTFHDGSLFDADAMVFSIKRFLQNGGKPSFLLSDLIQQDENKEYAIKATGKTEITIELNKPFAAFTDLLAFSGLVAISPDAYQDYIGPGKFKPTSFIGTGPYKLDTFSNDLIRLAVNKDYWGTAPANQGINVKLYSSSANLFNAFRTGTVDMTYLSLEPVQIEALEKQAQSGDWQVIEGQGNNITYLSLNLKDDDMKKVEVRQALASMIDRTLLKDRVFRGQTEPLYSLLPSIFEVSDPVFEANKQEPEQVKALLNKAGYSDQNPLNLILWYRSNVSSDGAAASNIKAVVERDFSPLVSLKLESIESAAAYENLEKGTYPIFMLDWSGDFYDPDNYIQPFMDCEKGSLEKGCEQGASQSQGSFYYNDRVNQLMDDERKEINPVKRKAIFNELQQILAKDVPFIPLWQKKGYVFAQTNVTGIQLQPSQQFSFAPLEKS